MHSANLKELKCTTDRTAKVEQERVENQLEASRELLKESDAYLRLRKYLVDSIRKGKDHMSHLKSFNACFLTNSLYFIVLVSRPAVNDKCKRRAKCKLCTC